MANPGETVRFRFGLAMAALLLALMALPMATGRVFVNDDLGFYFLPLRSFLARCLASGQDPAWCPDLFGGFYLYGEGQGVAHPWVRFLYSALPLGLAQNVEILWPYPILLAGFVLLLGRWGVRRDAAMFGGLMFAFGGYNLLHYVHISVMGLLAHLPWLLLAIDVAVRSDDPRRVALARVAVSLLTASQLLIGHVQFAWISTLGEVSYALLLASRVPGAGRRMVGLAVAKGLGVLGGSAQILPTWEAFRDSPRVAPSASFVAMGSLSPLNLIQWVAPYLTASRVVTPPMAVNDSVLAPATSMNDWRVKEFAVYYGAAVPALLIWLLSRRGDLGRLRPLAIFAAVLVVGSLVLALGDYTPLFRMTIKVPVAGRFRIPARYLVLFHLGMAMLAAVAYATLADEAARPGRVSWRRLRPLALAPLASVLVCLAPRLPEALWPSYLRGACLASTPLMIAGPILIGLATALVALSARGARGALVVLIAFAAVDQAAYGAHQMMLVAPRGLAEYLATRPTPPGGEAGARVKFDRLEPIWHDPYTMKGLKLVQGYVALMPRRQLSYDDAASLRVAGVGWVMSATDELGQPWNPAPAPPLPRARLVSRARPSSDPGRDIAAIDVETTALTDRPLSLPAAEPGRARIVGDRPGKIDVATEAGSRQLLVVSEGYHRGWQALVDGRPAPVLRAYGDFLGCVVPQGSHRVSLRFRPRGRAVGAVLSVIGLVLMVAVPALSLVPRRSRAGSRRASETYRVHIEIGDGALHAPHANREGR